MKPWRSSVVVKLACIFSGFGALISGMLWFTDNFGGLRPELAAHEVILRNLSAWIFWICLLLFIGGIIQSATIGKISRTFQWIFSVAAPEDNFDIQVLQPIVDKVLTYRAYKFKQARIKQEQCGSKKVASFDQLSEYKRLFNEVQTEKADFWGASNAAAYFGFAVRGRHEDWLTNYNINALSDGQVQPWSQEVTCQSCHSKSSVTANDVGMFTRSTWDGAHLGFRCGSCKVVILFGYNPPIVADTECWVPAGCPWPPQHVQYAAKEKAIEVF
jgi:hypothetical protein